MEQFKASGNIYRLIRGLLICLNRSRGTLSWCSWFNSDFGWKGSSSHSLQKRHLIAQARI